MGLSYLVYIVPPSYRPSPQPEPSTVHSYTVLNRFSSELFVLTLYATIVKHNDITQHTYIYVCRDIHINTYVKENNTSL